MERIFRERLKTGVDSITTLSKRPGFTTKVLTNEVSQKMYGIIGDFRPLLEIEDIPINVWKADVSKITSEQKEMLNMLENGIVKNNLYGIYQVIDEFGDYHVVDTSLLKVLDNQLSFKDVVIIEYIVSDNKKVITSITPVEKEVISRVDEDITNFKKDIQQISKDLKQYEIENPGGKGGKGDSPKA